MTALAIRSAVPEDAAALLAIYAPLVERTAISFELTPPGVDEFGGRIRDSLRTHAWLIAERQGAVAGYAYATTHRSRAAYRFSAETTVYIDPSHQRMGVGRRLYAGLFAALAERGYFRAFAGITLPNEASVALHRSVGFAPIGVFERVGFKFGRWHDVSWWQRTLRAGEPPADDPPLHGSLPGP